jgi:hypothetical protein
MLEAITKHENDRFASNLPNHQDLKISDDVVNNDFIELKIYVLNRSVQN